MKPAETSYKKLIVVCTNERTDGRECCMARGADELKDQLKLAVAAATPHVRVVKSSCLNNCADGITVVIQPDNLWFGQVTLDDIPEIVKLVS